MLGTAPEERKALCETIRAAGRAGIDASLFYPLDRFLHFHEYHEGRPLMVMPGDEDWGAVVAFFKEVVAAADEAGLRLGNHLWAVDVVHSIWEAAPSPNNGVTYCQGMWLIGEEPHTPAETWGHGPDLLRPRPQPGQNRSGADGPRRGAARKRRRRHGPLPCAPCSKTSTKG